jgi:hypothetical protein
MRTQRAALQLLPRRAAQECIKKAKISRAEGGQLQPPIRQAVRRYGRNSMKEFLMNAVLGRNRVEAVSFRQIYAVLSKSQML